MIRRILYTLLVTVILGGLAGAIYYWAFIGKPQLLATIILGSPQPAQTVSAEAARTDTWQPQISAIGTLSPAEGIDVTPQAGGVVIKIGFDSGQSVRQGDLLVQLDTTTEEADMRSLQTQLDNALSDLERKEGLARSGLTPLAELDALRTQRNRLTFAIDRLRAEIAQKSVFAPWDGQLGLRTISIGSYLSPGQKIVWLQKIDPIYADFQVTEGDFGRIKDGLKVTAAFNAYPGESFTGEIITTDARMSVDSRMITVRANIENPDLKLVPGMYANVLVDSGQPEQVVTVPQTAVTYSLYGDNVFVVKPTKGKDAEGKEIDEFVIERRFVKAGPLRHGRIQIVSGLAVGDQVVTAGHNKIDQGSKVLIDNSIALRQADTAAIE